MANWAWDGIKGFFGGLLTKVKALLGIQSPSTVFAEIGGFLVDGMLSGISTGWYKLMGWFDGAIDGIKAKWQGVTEWFGNTKVGMALSEVKAATPSVSSMLTTAGSFISDVGTGISKVVQTVQTVVPESLKQTVSSASTLPDIVKDLRIKDSSGRTRTAQEMGIETFSDLRKKGGQGFSGGFNAPTATYATALIQKGLGSNFNRLTGQNDRYHHDHKKGSEHNNGYKTDFTLTGISYAEGHKRITALLNKHGLTEGRVGSNRGDFEIISEKHGTAEHIDFKLNKAGQQKIAAMMPQSGMLEKAVNLSKAVKQDAITTASTVYEAGKSGKFSVIKAALAFTTSQKLQGLSEAQTRALAGNTMMTESHGNQKSVNSYGFSGQFQFGADALADGGLINLKKLKAAKASAGKAWYQGGYHKAFMANTSNWTLPGGQQAFLNN